MRYTPRVKGPSFSVHGFIAVLATLAYAPKLPGGTPESAK